MTSQAFDSSHAQGSEEWFASRLGKVTASRVAEVMSKGRGDAPSLTRDKYLTELLTERLSGNRVEKPTTAAMRRGNELEPAARTAYESYEGLIFTGQTVKQVPLIDHPTIAMFGASPDGLVGDNGLLEIKCPESLQHVRVIETKKHDPKYEWQMLAQMACTGRDWVDFVSYDDRMPEGLEYGCYRFHRDPARIVEMEREIIAFLRELDEREKAMRERMAA